MAKDNKHSDNPVKNLIGQEQLDEMARHLPKGTELVVKEVKLAEWFDKPNQLIVILVASIETEAKTLRRRLKRLRPAKELPNTAKLAEAFFSVVANFWDWDKSAEHIAPYQRKIIILSGALVLAKDINTIVKAVAKHEPFIEAFSELGSLKDSHTRLNFIGGLAGLNVHFNDWQANQNERADIIDKLKKTWQA